MSAPRCFGSAATSSSVAALVWEGLVALDEIAVDGTKVRSPASARSLARGGRLERIERWSG